MKKSKFVLWIFLGCLIAFAPTGVSGQSMMENLYNNLLKENSKTIKQIKFRYSDDPKELGKEYIIEYMDWYFYDQYGITNPTKLDEISKLEYQKSQQQKKKKVDR